jgi:uncharacterized RDD family membrane protein YckC
MYANIWKRVFAWFIDFILWFGLLGYFIAVLTHQTTPNGYSLKGLSAFFLFGISFLYYFLTEAIWGATLGKMLFKIKVVSEQGQKISYKQSLIRNLTRLIDMLPMFYVVGIMSVANSNKKQRLGDAWAHTIVVDSKN